MLSKVSKKLCQLPVRQQDKNFETVHVSSTRRGLSSTMFAYEDSVPQHDLEPEGILNIIACVRDVCIAPYQVGRLAR